MWQQLRSMIGRGSSSPEVIAREDGSLAHTHEDKLLTARTYFERLGRDTAPAGTFDDAFGASVSSEMRLAMEERIGEEPNHVLDSVLRSAEIEAVLLNLPSGRAAGPDRVHNEMLRHGREALASALLALFTFIWESEAWPEQWCRGNIILLHKSGPREQLDNYRGVTLLSAISKTFECVLNNRLYRWAEGEHKLRDEQGGFRPKRRAADQMFLLREITAARRERGLATFCAFIDVRKAYDTVWRDGLWQSLWDLQARGKMHRMLRAMFSSVERAVSMDGELSRPFVVELGVAQGAVTSPFLYATFINSLLAELDASGRGVTIGGARVASLAYADDIALVAPTPDDLRALLELLTQHARRWRFRFNAVKSNVMVFGTKRQIEEADSERFQLGPDEIRVTRDYKYLGCEASAFLGKSTAVIDRLVRVARFKGSDLSGPGGCRFNGVHAVRSINLWMAYVRPVLEYGVEIWTPTRLQAKKIESVLCDFARHALGVDRRTGNDVLLSELGLISLAARRDELRLRYLRHLCTMDPERTVAKVFRHRCEEVDAGRAERSLCAQYRTLAQRYDLGEAWRTRPSDTDSWSDWLPKVHQAVVELDLKERKERLEQKVSTTNYRVVKPLGRLSRSAYLYGRGLGVWLKLRLRVDNLPLLDVLARTARPPMSEHCASCLLCGGEREDVRHFLLRCSALQRERAQLSDEVAENMSALAESSPLAPARSSARRVAAVFAGADEESQLRLMLGCREDAVGRGRRAGSGSSSRPDDEDADEAAQRWPAGGRRLHREVLRQLDRLVQRYFTRVWLRRAELLGSVPMLDRRGCALAMGSLRPDGRCSFFLSRKAPVAD